MDFTKQMLLFSPARKDKISNVAINYISNSQKSERKDESLVVLPDIFAATIQIHLKSHIRILLHLNLA
jgi:hypothetical protein